MAYADQHDLLIGDVLSVDPRDQQQFINMAAAEIDSKLGVRYAMPLADLPPYQQDILKFINAKIATGRLIMAKTMGTEEGRPNAYALFLLQEADRDLMALANGDITLDAPPIDLGGDPNVDEDPLARMPGSRNHDNTSAVSAFEQGIMGDNAGWAKPVWRPGTADLPSHLLEPMSYASWLDVYYGQGG
jgi:phage gp36-like protein